MTIYATTKSCTGYSFLSEFTGFIRDTFKEWYSMQAKAISTTATPVPTKIHAEIETWYAKFFNQLLIKYQAIGQPIRLAINTSFRKSDDSRRISVAVDAPITRRIPISFVLLFAMKAVRPNKPSPPSMIESMENVVNIFKKRSSAR